jgi:hypothetical protein
MRNSERFFEKKKEEKRNLSIAVMGMYWKWMKATKNEVNIKATQKQKNVCFKSQKFLHSFFF